MFEAALFS